MYEEILSALHICTNDDVGCDGCPFYMSPMTNGKNCYDQMKLEAADVIEALQEQLQAAKDGE